MSESKSASVVFTNGSFLAKNAQQRADSAKSAAEKAQALASGAQKTADGKNKVYRVKDVSTIPTVNLKHGDICFTDNAVYTWTGKSWEKTVSDTTGAEIHAKVEAAMQESRKSVANLKTDFEAKAKQMDASLTAATNAVANDLSAAKENLATVANDLSATKASLTAATNKVANDLSAAKENLAAVSNDLSATKASLATVNSDLSVTKDSLADTGNKLAAATSEFQRQTGQLSGSLSTANSKIEFNSKAIAEVKHTAEEVSTTVSNLHSGDRNLARGVASSKDWFVFQGFKNLTNYCSDLVTYSLETLKAGDKVTFGITMKNEGVTSGTMIFMQWGNVSQWNRDYSAISSPANVTDFVPNGAEKALTYTITITDGMLNGNSTYTINIRTDNVPAGGKLSFRYAFVKKGTMATDWTPAPEDTDQAISKVSQTAGEIRADLTNAQNDVASVKITASSLQSQITDNKNNISSVKQTADSLTSTVGQMPAKWQQAINDKASAQVLDSNVDMNNLTTAGTYLIKDRGVKNAPVSAWFMATVESTADHTRVVQRVKRDADNIAYERSSYDSGWTEWERVATGTDVSSIKQTMDSITTRVSNAEGNVSGLQQTATKLQSDLTNAKGDISSLQQTASGLTSRVGNAEGNISQLQQTANGLTSTVSNLHSGDRNLARGVASSKDWFDFQGFNNLTNYCYDLVTYSLDTLKAGDKITFGITMKNEGVTSGTMLFMQRGNVSEWTRDYSQFCPAGNVTDFVPNGAEEALTYTITITDGMLNGNSTYTIKIRTDNVPAGGKLSFRYAFVKKGTMATDWTPAPEDVDDSISQVKQTADGISAYVKGSRGSQTLAALLSMDPNNSTIGQVVNGHVVAAINTSSDGSVKIDGKTLHITADTKIENAVIKSAMIDSIDASKITTGTLDASHINVINLDANSITTGSLSAALYSVTDFTNYTISASSTWNFDDTKSTHGNWFLIGETTSDHVYNGPKDANQNKLTPYMYVTSRGSSDGTRFTVTVWKDDDPTQYQRVWNGSSWSQWVMLPNSQNLVSAINLSPDSVKISGKNIELSGDTTITGNLNLLPLNQRTVNQFDQGLHNPWFWRDSKVFAGTGGLQLQSTILSQHYSDDNTSIGGLRGGPSAAITTLAPTYLKFTVYPSWNDVTNNFSNQLCRTYIDAGRIETNDVWAGNFRLTGHKMYSQDNNSLYVTNSKGTNFDDHGSVGFQVWGGIGLGKRTIYTPTNDLYIQQGNVGPDFDQSYDRAIKVDVHCNKVISQRANTIASRLSVKTDITKVTYDRALAAVEGTEMYDYRYISDDSGQHYVSGIIDDVNPEPQYHMDEMLINKERTARIDANLLGYHHVIIQKLLDRVAALEEKVKQ
ncbi:hypothetical protein ACXO8U_03050 [Lactobacillus delbrueckii subsp. bulgaricus]|nr:hypothetical protein [Lactobacillus delbrueckii subsp. bulgaricus]